MDKPDKDKIGIFLDADNITPYILLSISKRINNGSQNHEILCHRVYGTKETLNKQNAIYRILCKKYHIERVVTQCAKKGKNSTDIAMAVDVMDAVYKNGLDKVYLSTNDSDFYHLAHKLQTMGVRVIGMGFNTSTKSLRRACHEFYVIQQNEQKRDIVKFKQKIEAKKATRKDITSDQNAEKLIPVVAKAIKTLEFLKERKENLEINKLIPLTLMVDESFTLSGTKYRTIADLLIDLFPDIRVDMGKEHFSIESREARIIPFKFKPEKINSPRQLVRMITNAHKALSTSENSYISSTKLHSYLTEKYADFSIKRAGYQTYRSFFSQHDEMFERQKIDNQLLFRPKENALKSA